MNIQKYKSEFPTCNSCKHWTQKEADIFLGTCDFMHLWACRPAEQAHFFGPLVTGALFGCRQHSELLDPNRSPRTFDRRE
jgi:hypothetical protein